jgi:hypothetical protein
MKFKLTKTHFVGLLSLLIWKYNQSHTQYKRNGNMKKPPRISSERFYFHKGGLGTIPDDSIILS